MIKSSITLSSRPCNMGLRMYTSGCALQLMARQHTIYWGVVPCDVQLSVKPIRQAGD